MARSKNIQNLLFHGKSGIGKTSAARILIHGMELSLMELNGSSTRSDKQILKDIETFASSVSFDGGYKICFIEEADNLGKDAQASLRYVIEKTSQNTRFIFCANEIKRLTPAIQSRLMPICFDVKPADRKAVVDRMIKRYEAKLHGLGYIIDTQRLREIVSIYFPDLRSVANQVQFEVTS
jgi:DNA polymerase III delta prime subunit